MTRDDQRPAHGAGFDDATLVVRAQERDLWAFEMLVRRYQQRLYALAVRLLGDRTEAEDAMQEAFVSAWRRLPEFRGDAEFSSWIYRIVTNRCLNTARARRPTVPLDRLEETVATPEIHAPERVAEHHAQLAALTGALVELPDGLRVCWVLREIDGLSYNQIAAITAASPDAVRSRLYRARLQLSEVMRPWR